MRVEILCDRKHGLKGLIPTMHYMNFTAKIFCLDELCFELYSPDPTPQQNECHCSYTRNSWPGLFCDIYIYIPCARGPPQFSKKRSENGGANENISCGFPSIPGIAPGVAPRIVVFVLLKSWDAIPRMEFRIPRMEFRIPRVAPRIPRNAPRAPRMAFSLRERFS